MTQQDYKHKKANGNQPAAFAALCHLCQLYPLMPETTIHAAFDHSCHKVLTPTQSPRKSMDTATDMYTSYLLSTPLLVA